MVWFGFVSTCQVIDWKDPRPSLIWPIMCYVGVKLLTGQNTVNVISVMKLFIMSMRIQSPAVLECISLPCLRILQHFINPSPPASKKNKVHLNLFDDGLLCALSMYLLSRSLSTFVVPPWPQWPVACSYSTIVPYHANVVTISSLYYFQYWVLTYCDKMLFEVNKSDPLLLVAQCDFCWLIEGWWFYHNTCIMSFLSTANLIFPNKMLDIICRWVKWKLKVVLIVLLVIVIIASVAAVGW